MERATPCRSAHSSNRPDRATTCGAIARNRSAERNLDRDLGDRGDVLRRLWPDVPCVALLEYRSVSRPFRRGDLARLLSYGLTWFYAHQAHDALTVAGGVPRRANTDDLTLALVVPTVTPTLLGEIAQWRAPTLERRDDGYRRPRSGERVPADCTARSAP